MEYIPSILLTRIGNRLVHGQVGVIWTKALGANLIIMVDDTVVEDRTQQSLMNVTVKPSGVGTRFFAIEKTAAIIDRAAPEQKIFIACHTSKDTRRLVEAGVTLKGINMGNMHFSEGKRAMTRRVYVGDENVDNLKCPVSKGINVYVQDVSGDPGSAIE